MGFLEGLPRISNSRAALTRLHASVRCVSKVNSNGSYAASFSAFIYMEPQFVS